MNISILKVDAPNHFWAREVTYVLNTDKSNEATKFLILCKEMNEYFDLSSKQTPNLVIGEYYIVRNPKTQRWCRAQLESVFLSSQGYQTTCYLLDFASIVSIHEAWVRDAPEAFLKLPWQAKKFILHGLVPSSFATSLETIEISQRLGEKWNPAALEYVRRIVKNNNCGKAEILNCVSGCYFAKIYLKKCDNFFCLNNDLVDQNFATFQPDVQNGERPNSNYLNSKMHNLEIKTVHDSQEVELQALYDEEIHISRSSDSSNSPVTHRSPRSSPNQIKHLCNSETSSLELDSIFSNSIDSKNRNNSSSSYPESVSQRNSTILSKNCMARSAFSPVLSSKPSQESFEPKSKPALSRRMAIFNYLNAVKNNQISILPSPDSNLSTELTISREQSLSNDKRGSIEAHSTKHGASTLTISESIQNLKVLSIDTKETNAVNPSVKNNSISELTDQYKEPLGIDPSAGSSTSPINVYINHLPNHVLASHSQQLISPADNEPKNSLLKSLQKPVSTQYNATYDKNEILFFGDRLPVAITRLDQSPFMLFTKKIDTIDEPTDVECYGWPSVLRNRNTVIIAKANSGKTLSYLLPLVSNLSQKSKYNALPIGPGPLAVILTPSWRKAQQVYLFCDSLCRCISEPQLRTIVIFGGGGDHKDFQLMNGCEILIATPMSLLRFLQDHKVVTNFNRLCHFVLDGADTLLEEFTENVQEIILEYINVIKEKKRPNIPQQIIACSNHWTPGLDALVKLVSDPILLMTSKKEIAVASKVKIISRMCLYSQRMNILLGLLEGIEDSQKIVIHCTSKASVDEIVALLKNQSYYTLSAHDCLLRFHLDNVKEQWISSNTKRILVLQDSCIKDLQIIDAQCAVHYDFMETQDIFSHRLGCLMDYYKAIILKKDNQTKLVGSIHLLITKHWAPYASGLVKVLRRCNANIPKKLLNMASEGSIQVEKKKNKVICPFFKAYGMCSLSKCLYRHIILADTDQPKLVQSGIVRILVTQVVNASRYYARLCKHRDSKGATTSFSNSYFNLCLDLNNYFSKESNCLQLQSIEIGALCAIRDKDDAFHRGRIMIVKTSNRHGQNEVDVFLVDKGESCTFKISELLILPDQFKNLPFQAVEIYICFVRPADQDSEWTTVAGEFIHQLVYNKELDGQILLSLGNTLWLEPLVERSYLKTLNTMVHGLNVRRELLNEKFATENENHLNLLLAACEGKIELPKPFEEEISEETSQVKDLSQHFSFLFLEGYQEVYVQIVISPELFYVQRTDKIAGLDALLDEVNSPSELETLEMISSPSAGCLCFAKLSDDKWYRAIIEKVITELDKEDTYYVFFVDYGDSNIVTKDSIREMKPRFQTLPFLAIKCSLYQLEPVDGEWNQTSGDLFWDLAHFEDGGQCKNILAKVHSKVQPSRTLSQALYIVELFDTTSIYDVDLGWELVLLHVASPTDEYFQNLIVPSNMSSDDCNLAKILVALCIQIYKSANELEKLEVVQILYEKLLSSEMKEKYYNELHSKFLSNSGLVKILCRLLKLNWSVNIKNKLALCLVHLLFYSEYIYDLAYQEGAVTSLIAILNATSDEVVQTKIIEVLANMADPESISDLEIACDFDRKLEILISLFNLLFTIESESLKKCICITLQTSIPSNFENFDKPDHIVQSFCTLISQSSGSLLYEVLKLFLIIIKDHSVRVSIRKENILNILFSKLNQSVGADLQLLIMQIFDKLVIRNKKTSEAALKIGLLKYLTIKEVEILQDAHYLDKIDQKKFKKLLSNLISKLTDLATQTISCGNDLFNIKKEPEDLPPLINMECKFPSVSWTQSGSYLKLFIKLNDVSEDRFEWRLTPSKLEVHIIASDQLYSLELELLNKVIPKLSCYILCASEIQIHMRKVSGNKKWIRLVKQRKIPRYLSVDYDRYCSSSDDDPDNESNNVESKSVNGVPVCILEDEPHYNSSESESDSEFSDSELSDEHVSSKDRVGD